MQASDLTVFMSGAAAALAAVPLASPGARPAFTSPWPHFHFSPAFSSHFVSHTLPIAPRTVPTAIEATAMPRRCSNKHKQVLELELIGWAAQERACCGLGGLKVWGAIRQRGGVNS
jgi:hypothetical protein